MRRLRRRRKLSRIFKRGHSPNPPVILRRWKGHNRSVIALFPTISAGGGSIQSYEHIGQHGGASLRVVMRRTTPVSARDLEAKELLAELRQRGYRRLRVVRRAAATMRAALNPRHRNPTARSLPKAAAKVRALWKKALAWEHIKPGPANSPQFVTFSPGNPYARGYDNAVMELMTARRSLGQGPASFSVNPRRRRRKARRQWR